MAEKEYIEREAAEKELLYAMVGTGYQSRAIDAITFMPAADVVEVVRCKDCNSAIQCDRVLYCTYFNKNVDMEDFCSQGG